MAADYDPYESTFYASFYLESNVIVAIDAIASEVALINLIYG